MFAAITALHHLTRLHLSRVHDRLADDDGQTAVEWLGIAMVILAIVVIVAGNFAQPIAQTINENFQNLLDGATTGDNVQG